MQRIPRSKAERESRRSGWLAAGLFCSAITAAQADFYYADFSSIAGLTLNGSAAQTGGSILRLTPDAGGQSGSAWYATAKVHVAGGFDTTFDYQMNGASESAGAEGLAFVIQDNGTAALGSGGSGLGFGGISRSLAVELDTSGVSPETNNHISVQTRGSAPNSSADQYALEQAEPGIDLNDGSPHTILIRYRPGVLVVYLDSPTKVALVVGVDLQNIAGDNILDGAGDAWIGFTAATGALSQEHNLFSWSFVEATDPLPTGTCCLPGTCIQTTAYDCVVTQGGVYREDDATCEATTCYGSCCTFKKCIETTRANCTDNLSGLYQGVGTICKLSPCDGACCDTYGYCFITRVQDCTDNYAGEFHGPGSTCDAFPCTQIPLYGACCVASSCYEVTAGDCATSSGVFYGRGTYCFEINCVDSPAPTGACCQVDEQCVVTVQSACEYFNATYSGDGVSCATANCAGDGGACCLPDGGCSELPAAECQAQSGHFQGLGVPCSHPDLNCAAVGRCCFNDGTPCFTTSVNYCLNVLGGDFFSTPLTCDQAACPPYGACCNSVGICSIQFQPSCSSPGQTFLGTGTTCTPDPCNILCTCDGDMTGDLVLDGRDVQRFVDCARAAMGGAPTSTCGCADLTDDGLITSTDTSAFVAALLTGPACP